MTLPFSFSGPISRSAYALWSLCIFLSQHLIVLVALKLQNVALDIDWPFALLPLRSLAKCEPHFLGGGCAARVSDLFLILALAYTLIAAWALAALAFRRAAAADISEWVAAAAMVPAVQLPVIAFLSVFPSRILPVGSPQVSARSGWVPAVQGLAAGTALTLFGVGVGALLFGSYGYGVFVVSPFLVGAITAYFANRRHDIGAGRTSKVVAGATALGALGLVAAALEGAFCIILAAPLGIGVALVGGLMGRAIALVSNRPATHALSGFALLPVIFALETALPATTQFDTRQTIEIRASPDIVWRSILHMEKMDAPSALLSHLGVAYPVRGEVLGEGVGAVRHGEFSTGTAVERVTEWVPNRKLAFVVLTDVPAMRELSPYQRVRAPHVVGYFRTTHTSFDLVQKADGLTEVVERTSHELKLDPVLYWLPLARKVVHENNAGVLAHLRRQAEKEQLAAHKQ